MSMPKGHKSDNGYATIVDYPGAKGYREIAELMTEEGFKMNHSTARNIFLASMKKIVVDVCEMHKKDVSDKDIYKIASDPRFQAGIYDILCEMNSNV